MLITLMLVIALAAMALLAILPSIGQQIRRDREEEMRNRGTAYARAIQHYYKKFGRYPTRIEDLENTNNVRFLRKRYKDPLNRDPQTGKERDFKLLHMQDVTLNNGPMLGQAPGLGGLPGQAGLPGGPSGPGGALGQAGMQAALGQMQQLGGLQQSGSSAAAQNNSDDESPSGNSANPQGNSNSSSPSSPFGSSPGSGASGGLSGQSFGGGPILGVASLSKAPSIREFNKKSHYNEWFFIYDPTSDRGGLLVGPWQTPPPMALTGATQAGQPLQGGQAGQGFGQGFSQGLSQPNNSQPQNAPPQPPPQNPEQNSPPQ